MKKNVIEPIVDKDMGTATQEGGINTNKVYTFRSLNSTDLFTMFKIIKNIGLNEFAKSFDSETIKSLVNRSNGADNASTVVGISVMLEFTNIILGNLPKCETEIYQLLSNTSNLTVNQVKTLDFATFTEMVVDFIKKEEFKDFIKVVLKLFKPMI